MVEFVFPDARRGKKMYTISHPLSTTTFYLNPCIQCLISILIVDSACVSPPDGRRLASKYHSKYIAVSAVLNHRVDELLAGVLHQVRLARHAPCRAGNEHSWVAKAAMGLSRVMRKHPFYFRSCDNLLVL